MTPPRILGIVDLGAGMDYWLGIDFGTSGARAIALDSQGGIAATSRVTFPQTTDTPVAEAGAEDGTSSWQATLGHLLKEIPPAIRHHLRGLACNGTSGTVLLVDGQGQVLAPPLMYNDGRGQVVVASLATTVPADSLTLSATSSLAKLRWWHRHLPRDLWAQARYLLHQADWLAYQFHGRLGLSDYHNALKLGYDPAALAYPPWLQALPETPLLPQVVPPGTDLGPITPRAAAQYDLCPHCRVKAGTTDSIAAFLASGVTQPGAAVTSLGSTLVLKLLSTQRVEDRTSGVYSHRLGDSWLVGGASNTGGAVLRHFFPEADLVTLSQGIDCDRPSGLDYYPLLCPGERFPINDAHYLPRLTPRPGDDHLFLQGLLEAMARIEALGYQRLEQLGAPPVHQVWTAGGGAKNPTWTHLRQKALGVPVAMAPAGEAAVGTARLAMAPLTLQGNQPLLF